jgi:hypothetical protein
VLELVDVSDEVVDSLLVLLDSEDVGLLVGYPEVLDELVDGTVEDVGYAEVLDELVDDTVEDVGYAEVLDELVDDTVEDVGYAEALEVGSDGVPVPQ